MLNNFKIVTQAFKVTVMIILIPFAYIVTDITCLIRMVFDVPCPFCGMTRAWLSALQFDFSKAYDYHPLFWLFPFFLLLLIPLLAGSTNKKLMTLAIVVATIFFFTYIIRLLFFKVY